jgi:sn-glycerol 3-phosphate transport system permease protein
MAQIGMATRLHVQKEPLERASGQVSWVGRRYRFLERAVGYLGMAFVILLIGVPVYWMVLGAFKSLDEIYRLPATWWPERPTLSNFPAAWNSAPFGRYYINTIITTASGSGFEILFAITSAYAFAFLRFPRKDRLFMLLLAALMIPNQITILPNFVTLGHLGWINTYQGIVVPGASVAYGTFLLRQYYLTLPRSVLDAAKVDGAGHLRVLVSIVLPLAKPSVITFALISIVTKWNDFLWPLLVTNTQEMRVLPIGIFWLRVEEGQIAWNVVLAGTLFVVVPVLIVFLGAQRYIVDGIAAGAVKG